MSQSQHILPPNHAVLTILVYKVIISVQREILSIDLVGFYFELDLERDDAVVFNHLCACFFYANCLHFRVSY